MGGRQAGGGGVTAHGSTQRCRITRRSEPSAGPQKCGQPRGQLHRVRREWADKGGGVEGGAEQADQLSLLFVSLHYSESRTGAFSSSDPHRPAVESVRTREAAAARTTQVAVRRVHAIRLSPGQITAPPPPPPPQGETVASTAWPD